MSDHAVQNLGASARTHSVLVYSDDATVRDQVRGAIGRRPAADLGRIEWVECSTGKQVVAAVDAGGVDAVVLDGEAWPTGGMGLAKQMKDELADCPPVCVLIARRDDRWLATWSQADAVVSHPIDAPELTSAVADLLRRREAGLPVRRALH
ncbi:MAG: response regulator receiver protein [Frankiales bacterium]|jgi:DNA-binding response OmpR family regulator|nr:response regulator receiver protein [Frankiales bacterium]